MSETKTEEEIEREDEEKRSREDEEKRLSCSIIVGTCVIRNTHITKKKPRVINS